MDTRGGRRRGDVGGVNDKVSNLAVEDIDGNPVEIRCVVGVAIDETKA